MKHAVSASVLLAAMSTSAFAWDAGDLIVRGGGVNVDPDASSSLLAVEDSAVPGTGVDVGDDTQLMLTFTYMIDAQFGVEVLAATPFEHDVFVNGLDGLGVPSGAKLGDVTHLPPTVAAVWYPLGGQQSAFQPFVGIGVNYTYFWDEKVSPAAEDILGAGGLSLDASFGLAGRAGVDFKLNDNWSLNAGLWYIDIESDASVLTALGRVTVDAKIDPWVYGLGIGYKF
jgi:outer membrane protein